MNLVDQHQAIQHIRHLKARYFRCMDTKDWDGMRAVFAPDAVLDMSAEAVRRGAPPEDGITRGGDLIVERMQRSLANVSTVHHGHMPEIRLVSDVQAIGIWAMEDMLRWEDPASPLAELHGYGHYHETYEHLSGEWRIKSLRLDRLRVDTIPR
jgi:SnoaL-like domain